MSGTPIRLGASIYVQATEPDSEALALGHLWFDTSTSTLKAVVSLDPATWQALGAGVGTAWGGITGTLSVQTDLGTALDGKAASTHAHGPSDVTGTAVVTNDARLSDARTPLTHTHSYEPVNANIQTHVASSHAPAGAQANADITKAEIEAKLTGELSSHTHAGGGGPAFPVGSVFIAVVATDPATLLGYGTWSAFGAGRVLVGLNAGDADFDTAEETGGAKTHTLTEAELPAHVHGELAPSSASGGALRFAVDTNASGSVDAGLNTASAGSGSAHNNVQPYIVVYMWKRTA